MDVTDQNAPTEEFDGTCARCGEEYDMPIGAEPTKYCHDCAHERVAELEALIEAPAPSPGLLMSMALRYDHGIGFPGYYDQDMFRIEGVTHAQRLSATLTTMRQLWEEVVGKGFYKPEKESEYVAMQAAVEKGA